jgi:hypothetical protein
MMMRRRMRRGRMRMRMRMRMMERGNRGNRGNRGGGGGGAEGAAVERKMGRVERKEMYLTIGLAHEWGKLRVVQIPDDGELVLGDAAIGGIGLVDDPVAAHEARVEGKAYELGDNLRPTSPNSATITGWLWGRLGTGLGAGLGAGLGSWRGRKTDEDRRQLSRARVDRQD